MASNLTQDEFAAIQQSMARPKAHAAAAAAPDPIPIALIAADRDAEKARPDAARLAARWAKLLPARLRRVCNVSIEIESVSVDIIVASDLNEELEKAWSRCIRFESHSALGLLTAIGPMVESLAAGLFGAAALAGADDRPPSAVALELFGSLGETVSTVLGEAWAKTQRGKLSLIDDDGLAEDWRRNVQDELLVSIAIKVGGGSRGTIGLLAQPQALVIAPPPTEAVPAPPGAVQRALGAVPIDIRVELGRARMTMSTLARLAPGNVIPLDKFIRDPLPIRVGGKIKGYGSPLASDGSLSIAVVNGAHGGGIPQ